MNPPPRPAPSHVPTLTEVIEIPDVLPAVGAPVMPTAPSPVPSPVQSAVAEPASFEAPVPPVPPAPPAPAVPPAQAPLPPVVAMPAPLPVPVSVAPLAPASPVRTGAGVDEAAMAQRVLNEVQRQIDGMLEYRLREALTPILARTSESLVRELRQELSKTMRDVVSRAVAQEVARQRTRP